MQVLQRLHLAGALAIKPKASRSCIFVFCVRNLCAVETLLTWQAHCLAHIIYNIQAAAGPCLNPWTASTWRDEDFIGKIMRMVKSVHARSQSLLQLRAQ